MWNPLHTHTHTHIHRILDMIAMIGTSDRLCRLAETCKSFFFFFFFHIHGLFTHDPSRSCFRFYFIHGLLAGSYFLGCGTPFTHTYTSCHIRLDMIAIVGTSDWPRLAKACKISLSRGGGGGGGGLQPYRLAAKKADTYQSKKKKIVSFGQPWHRSWQTIYSFMSKLKCQ